MKSFETQSFGKWILAGEHAVLRGYPALVFPLLSRGLKLSYLSVDENLKLEMTGEHGKELQLLFWGVLEKACELKNIQRNDLKGHIKLDNMIPVGAGMGASAAFCVAMARWFQSLGYVEEAEVYEFSRQLENLFHGESSGVDIAVALSAQPLKFVRGEERTILKPVWTPRLYVSYSGKRGVTVDCVNQVKSLLSSNPALGEKIDREMNKAVQLCLSALCGPEADRQQTLAEGMDMATRCFHQWGLVQGDLEKHMSWLEENGALAVKPTGSGGGGFVLSLWDQEPRPEVRDLLISCF